MLRRAGQASLSAARGWSISNGLLPPTALRGAAYTLLARGEAADASSARGGASQRASWITGASALLGVSAAAAAGLLDRSECEASTNAKETQQGAGVSLLSPERRKMTFFRYERSLRHHSSPDKVRLTDVNANQPNFHHSAPAAP